LTTSGQYLYIGAIREAAPASEVLTLDKPEQLKALGHPLRLRVLEMLGAEDEEPMTNRELAQRLGVDPGHLHFHVKMLLRAGLIERADSGKGREKPYRALAKTVRVAPQLLHSSLTTDLQAAMLEEVQRGFETHQQGGYRSAQVTVRISAERALELLTEFVEKAQEEDTPAEEPVVLTGIVHPALGKH
jgi:DNA-binding transcriptional ArsR family regulator